MSDPLRDPRFPNRPQTPDFWRLAETSMKLDGRTDAGQSTVEATGDAIDMDSLLYAAEQRIDLMLAGIYMNPTPKVRAAMIATYVSGVVHGIEFQRSGGHRD